MPKYKVSFKSGTNNVQERTIVADNVVPGENYVTFVVGRANDQRATLIIPRDSLIAVEEIPAA